MPSVFDLFPSVDYLGAGVLLGLGISLLAIATALWRQETWALWVTIVARLRDHGLPVLHRLDHGALRPAGPPVRLPAGRAPVLLLTRLLLGQLAPRPGEPHENMARIDRVVRATPSDLAVFPELFLSGYRVGDRFHHLALRPGDPAWTELVGVARASGTTIVVGALSSLPNGRESSRTSSWSSHRADRSESRSSGTSLPSARSRRASRSPRPTRAARSRSASTTSDSRSVTTRSSPRSPERSPWPGPTSWSSSRPPP